MEIFYIMIGIIAGILAGWIFAQSRLSPRLQKSAEDLAGAAASLNASERSMTEKCAETEKLKADISSLQKQLTDEACKLTAETSAKKALEERLSNQKQEMEEMNKRFNTEFENIANKILETKSEKFTDINKKNISAILEPLGKNIEEFKKTVNETYDKESKERFSLGEKVKELALLNHQISEEAKNLTRALKGESKTQGCWGEMILETILEKSGLRKGEEYFMEYQLTDEEGNPLRSDAEGKKMRPDAVIKYPDNRSVIIDSKVSLNAFSRYSDAADPDDQKEALASHVRAVRERIDELSIRGYDDYDKALDFVMMFIPSEPAYIAALQGDPELWNYAYVKRILLINPTNLIASLKLIVDLWKRENQNKNAQLIADRGARMYDKLCLFVENLKDVGKHIDKAREAYSDSFSQLNTGKDNLVLQAEKLRKLGIKNRKGLPDEIVRIAEANELSE
jgi:DNA recombination protein RmuC